MELRNPTEGEDNKLRGKLGLGLQQRKEGFILKIRIPLIIIMLIKDGVLGPPTENSHCRGPQWGPGTPKFSGES